MKFDYKRFKELTEEKSRHKKDFDNFRKAYEHDIALQKFIKNAHKCNIKTFLKHNPYYFNSIRLYNYLNIPFVFKEQDVLQLILSNEYSPHVFKQILDVVQDCRKYLKKHKGKK